MADKPAPDPPPSGLAEELARLDKTIADMAAANLKLDQDRKDLTGKLEVAKHRRDVLAHAIAERERAATENPATDPDPRPETPRKREARAGATPAPPRPPSAPHQPAQPVRPRVQVAPPPPEASSRSVQTIMLGLGALLLGIAAIVFVGVAITELDPWSQLVILLAVTGLFLGFGPVMVGRGLTATAETLAAVGLLVFAVAGYPLWTTGAVAGVSDLVYGGLVAAATAIVGYGYHLLTRLAVPAWAAVLALQPVLPMVGAALVTGPAGWALLLALVATHNAAIGAVTGTGRWLGYLTWVLHAIALGASIGFSTAGLFLAGAPTEAVPAGLTLILAAVVGLVGALQIGRQQLVDLAGGLVALAVIVAASRVMALLLPGQALLPIAAIMTATTLAGLLLPRADRAGAPEAAVLTRRGPMRACAWALAAYGVVLAGLALRAGVATVVWPAWPDELTGYQRGLADAVGPAGWQLAATAVAATVGAGFALPTAFRREVTVAGAALSALAAPASLGLPPALGAWAMVLVAAGLGVTGLGAKTRRAAGSHVGAAAAVGLVAAGAALAGPLLSAAILAALTVTGAIVAALSGFHPSRAAGAQATDLPQDLRRPRAGGGLLPTTRAEPVELVQGWAAGGATLAAPGAAATGAAAAGFGTSQVLASAFVAVCVTLVYAALTQLRDRLAPLPVRAGTLLGAAVVTVAAALVSDSTLIDQGIAALLLAAAGLVFAAPHVDAIRRPDRLLDGADLAAAAVTAGLVATLARVAALMLPFTGPDAGLATAATLVLLVAVGVRGLPAPWRRGPVVGVASVGALVGGIAGTVAVVTGARVLGNLGPLWSSDLSAWPPPATVADVGWAAPFSLVLLAVAAAVTLPRHLRHRVSATLAALATVAAPVALGLDWWAPATLSIAVAAGFALAAVSLRAEAAVPRAVAAAGLAGYALSASLVRPWTTAAVLGTIGLVGIAVAAIAAHRASAEDPRRRIGGTAVAVTLLAVPGSLAAVASELGYSGGIGLLAALGGVSLGLAALAALTALTPGPAAAPGEPQPSGQPGARRFADRAGAVTPYLPYGTVGITAGATATALGTLATRHPTGVYAAAAVLLAVLAELLRAAARRRYQTPSPTTTGTIAGRTGMVRAPRALVDPPLGALLAAAIPALIALIAIGPALGAALIDPYQTLGGFWEGPPTGLTAPHEVPATSVLAALLLTLATALAAVGFGGAVAGQAAPVVAPGLAITVLIAPAALDAPWPTNTLAALAVFTISMLGVALTPPPPPYREARPLRFTRLVVLGIGLAAGGAGLAGSFATPELTWGTLGGAIAVGATAALGGRTRLARLAGWLGAAVAAQLFALTTAYLLGASRPQLSFALLAVSAVALLAVARLPQLRPLGGAKPDAFAPAPRFASAPGKAAAPELAAVEGVGGYLPLLFAVVLTLAPESILYLGALLIGAGAVLGVAAVRPGRSHRERRVLRWIAAVSEVIAMWIVMVLFQVGLLEAYTLPFAAFALLVGALEVRSRPELGSWVTYGPGLIAALGPSLLAVITTTSPAPARQVWVILGGVAALLLGSRLGQRAPLIIGTVVTTVAALHLLSLAGPWLMLIPLGVLLLVLGANREKRQRDLERLRGAYSRMR